MIILYHINCHILSLIFTQMCLSLTHSLTYTLYNRTYSISCRLSTNSRYVHEIMILIILYNVLNYLFYTIYIHPSIHHHFMTITTRLFPSIHHLNTTISSIATDMGLLQERITSTGVGSITSVQVLVCCAVLYRLYYKKMIVMVLCAVWCAVLDYSMLYVLRWLWWVFLYWLVKL